MAGPWEQFQTKTESGPWTQFQGEPEQPAKLGNETFPETLRKELQNADWATRNIAGAGTALSNLWERAKQAIGRGDENAIKANRIIAEEAPIGSIAGNMALLAPTAFIPGANTYAGSAAIGAVTGALQPTVGDESTLNNIGIGAAGGVAGKGLGDLASKAIGAISAKKAADLATKQAQNAPLDESLRAAVEAGYGVPPGMRPDSGIIPRLAEGISGRDRTNALLSVKNQEITDSLARKAVGLPKDAALTSEAMQQIRKQAYQQGYAPVANAGNMAVDDAYHEALNKIAKQYTGAAGSFKQAIPDEVGNLVESFRVPNFDAGDALQASQALRDQATAAFRRGDTGVAKAAKDVAKALEDQIERNLSTVSGNAETMNLVQTPNGPAYLSGKDMLQNFRDARRLMAKAHTIEDAIQEGGGMVNAKKIASRLQSGKPLSDELKTIGQFANNFGKVAGIPQPGASNPITALDALFAGASSFAHPAALGIPAVRAAMRYGIASKAGQRAMGLPSYEQNALMQLLNSGAQNQLVRRALPALFAGEAVSSPATGP